jgi:hypothetical protein
MPSFPPGTPNNLSVTPVPVQVFTPTPGAPASVRVYNAGSSVAYVGGANVSPVSGFAILPGNRPVALQNINVNLYACSGVSAVVATTGVLNAAVAAGTSAFTLSAGSVAAGNYVRVGNGTGVEYVQANTASVSGTTVSTTTPLLYDHAASATVATVTAAAVPISVQAGVV